MTKYKYETDVFMVKGDLDNFITLIGMNGVEGELDQKHAKKYHIEITEAE